jgi:hypothetical protein
MAQFNDRISISYVGDGVTLVSVSVPESADSVSEFADVIAANATNQLVNIAFPVTGLQSLLISATGALTLKTNSATTPANTLVLAANVPYIWTQANADVCAITVAVTAIYASNAAATPVTLTIRALSNQAVA